MSEPLRLVVDSSVSTKWVLKDEEHAEVATSVFLDFQRGRIELVAPAVMPYEAGSAIIKAYRRRRINVVQAREGLELVPQWGIGLVDGFLSEALALVDELGCSFYDGLYLALARQTGYRMVSADSKLRGALRGRFPLFLWIEDYHGLPFPV